MAKRKILWNLVKKDGAFNSPLKNVLTVTLAGNILTILIVLVAQGHLPPQVPLYYGLAEGEEQLSSPLGLIIPSGLSLGILLVNTALTSVIKNDFLQKILVLASFAVTVFSVITTVKIILLVGSF